MAVPFLDHLRAESARFVDVLEATDPDAVVPTCPDWSATDLLWHVAEGQGFWASLIDGTLSSPAAYERGERPAADDLPTIFRHANARLVSLLETTSDDTPVWTWLEREQHVGFVRRRQAHEVTIHRLDAELTAGNRTGIDADLATDGVLEAFEWVFGGAPSWAQVVLDGPVGRLATTDTDASWTVQLGRSDGSDPASGATLQDAPTLELVDDASPDFEVVAEAADLLAWVWDRPSVGPVRTSGDVSGFAAVRSAAGGI